MVYEIYVNNPHLEFLTTFLLSKDRCFQKSHRENLACLYPEMGNVYFQSAPHALVRSDVHHGGLRGCIQMCVYGGVLYIIQACRSWIWAASRGFFWQFCDPKGIRIRAVKPVAWRTGALEKVEQRLGAFRSLCSASKAPVVAWRVCAHGPLGPRPVVQAASSPWRVCETQDGPSGPKHLEILLWEYYGFSLFGTCMFCFEKLM